MPTTTTDEIRIELDSVEREIRQQIAHVRDHLDALDKDIRAGESVPVLPETVGPAVARLIALVGQRETLRDLAFLDGEAKLIAAEGDQAARGDEVRRLRRALERIRDGGNATDAEWSGRPLDANRYQAIATAALGEDA